MKTIQLDNELYKVRSKNTGYEYVVYALRIDRFNKITAYLIYNLGRYE